MQCARSTAACVLLLGTLAAQDLGAVERRSDRFDLAPTMAVLRQHVRDTADEDRTVASSSWLALAFLANGSTMRSGPHREELKVLARWLRESGTGQGSFAPGGVPCSRGDQMLGALAVCETAILSNYQLLRPTGVRAATVAAEAFEQPGSTPASAEEAAQLALLAATFEWDRPGCELAARLRGLASAQLQALVLGRTRRADAALQAAKQQLGAQQAPDLTAALAWPGDLAADPLHSWFATVALTPHPAYLERYASALERLSAARSQAQDLRSTWAPAGGFDEITTTAILVCVLCAADARLPLVNDAAPK